MLRFTGNLSLSVTGRMLGFDTWITLYISVSTTMPRKSKEKEICTYFICAVLTKTDRHHLYRRGYREAKEQLPNLQVEKRRTSSQNPNKWQEASV